MFKDNKSKTGLRVKLIFEFHIHKKDLIILEHIQKFFEAGKIHIKNNDSVSYVVTSVKDLPKICQHFAKYPLLTTKRVNF